MSVCLFIFLYFNRYFYRLFHFLTILDVLTSEPWKSNIWQYIVALFWPPFWLMLAKCCCSILTTPCLYCACILIFILLHKLEQNSKMILLYKICHRDYCQTYWEIFKNHEIMKIMEIAHFLGIFSTRYSWIRQTKNISWL